MDWSQQTEGLDENQLHLVRYLDGMRQLKRQMHEGHPLGWHYLGIEDFLLQHGTWYKTPGTIPEDALGTMKECFRNSFLNSIQHLTYVEGYALHIIPVHHAWNVDESNNLIDATWKNSGLAYLGVPFKGKKLLTAMRQCGSVLDNWRNHWKIYEKEYKP